MKREEKISETNEKPISGVWVLVLMGLLLGAIVLLGILEM